MDCRIPAGAWLPSTVEIQLASRNLSVSVHPTGLFGNLHSFPCNCGLTVRYDSMFRLQNAPELLSKMRQYIAKLRAGGRALDLSPPMRCMFCAAGTYSPLVPLPPLKQRWLH